MFENDTKYKYSHLRSHKIAASLYTTHSQIKDKTSSKIKPLVLTALQTDANVLVTLVQIQLNTTFKI